MKIYKLKPTEFLLYIYFVLLKPKCPGAFSVFITVINIDLEKGKKKENDDDGK